MNNKQILINQIINILQNKNKTLIQQLYNIIYNYFQKKLQKERNKISTIRVPPNGTIVIFDKEDEDKILPYSWYETPNGYITRTASTYERNNNIPTTIGLHRQILNVLDKKEIEVDHINCIKWDNRKKNLRLASSRDNKYNQLLIKSNTSGIKGVSIKKSYDKYYWRASIRINNKRLEKLFPYTDEGKYQAQQWYDNMANIKYKEFAKTNIAIQNQYKIINEINLLLTDEDYNKSIHTSIKGQSNYLGVHFSKEKWSNGKYKYHWKAFLTYKKQVVLRKFFPLTPTGLILAAQAVNTKLLELYGDRAKLNIIDMTNYNEHEAQKILQCIQKN